MCWNYNYKIKVKVVHLINYCDRLETLLGNQALAGVIMIKKLGITLAGDADE